MVEALRTRGRIPASEAPLRERELLDTAARLFTELGFNGVAVEALARSARVSPKTIYARYGGKDGLFLAAMKPKADRVVALLEADPADAKALVRVLAAFGESVLDVSLSPSGIALQRLLYGEAERFPELARAFFQAGPARGLAALERLFRRGTECGYLRCPNPRDAAEFFVGALQGERLRAALLFGERLAPAARRARARAAARTIVRAYERAR